MGERHSINSQCSLPTVSGIGKKEKDMYPAEKPVDRNEKNEVISHCNFGDKAILISFYYMKRIMKTFFFFLMAGMIFNISCKKVESCNNCGINPQSTGTNKPPVANAGPDQIVTLQNNPLVLNGGRSADPDNNITGFTWSKISGPSSFNMANANIVITQLTVMAQGNYQFELKVTDGGGLISKDTMLVSVSDTLSGREFIFDGLTWELGDFYGTGVHDIYVGTPARPDLFQNSSGLYYNLNLHNGEVYIKFKPSGDWIQITPYSLFQPGGSGPYLYDIVSPYLYVHAFPLNYQLEGTSVSIKVKFL